MAILAINRPVPAGTTLAGGAANSGGDEFQNDGDTILLVHNTGGSNITITFATPGSADGLTVADLAVTVAANTPVWIGPFPREFFNNADGNVSMTYSSATNLSIWPISVR